MKDYLQQGDVLVFRIDSIPQNAKKIKQKPLAFGEHSNTKHVIAEDCEMYEIDRVLYLKTDKPVNLKHEEHKTITIDKGTWKVGIIQEYDPFMEEARNVRD